MSTQKAGKMQGKIGKYHPPVETRFKPGQSGNPKGRKKGAFNAKNIYKTIAAELEPTTGKELFALLVRSMYKQALRGDVSAAKMISENTIGRPAQPNEETECAPFIINTNFTTR